jgi:hypothetical protein
MALVMVQGHVMDTLLTRAALAEPWYVWQQMLHGSTAPGFLFASGFVAGLPRAPLSLRAGLRRGRRLLFVLGVGYYLHLPYFSLWKTLGASTSAERALLFACDALHVIAATQLLVLLLQWLVGRSWTRWAGVLAILVVVATPFVWSAGLGARLPEALAPWVDEHTGSRFPVFPFSAFVLAGTLAGATGLLVLMLPLLLAAAWLWRTAKHRAPHEAELALVFVTVAFLYEFAVRPWCAV